MIKCCALIGVGLMGGSLGLALRARGLARRILGVDIDGRNLEAALAAGAIDEIAGLEEAVVESDVIILATPVGVTLSLLLRIKDYLQPGAVVTDVGSTKKELVEAAELVLGGRFVGGHPMAGAETVGFAGADPLLLENAFYLLTPTPTTHPDALELVRNLVAALGAQVLEMSPREHDLVTAAVSHLPHLVAVTLVQAVLAMPGGSRALALAAGGFRDTTRIAAGSPVMWRDIFLSNRHQVLRALTFFQTALEDMKKALELGNGDQIESILAAASNTRRALPVQPKGYLPPIYEIVVTVPDQPGIIAALAGLLGRTGINIAEIEILRAREGYGGTIRIGFITPGEQTAALAVLQENNIKCRPKDC